MLRTILLRVPRIFVIPQPAILAQPVGWCWSVCFRAEHKKQVFYISGFLARVKRWLRGKLRTSKGALQGFLIRLDSIS